MEIAEETRAGVLILAPGARLDSITSGAFETRLMGALAAGQGRLIVDLGRVDYISSAGLRVLLLGSKKLREAQGALVLCGLGPAVRQVFDLAGFTAIFTIEPSRDGALSRLGAA